MPRKIRELRSDLRAAGFVMLRGRGKGSHTFWMHPLLPHSITLAGADGKDARPYQERDVKAILQDLAKRQQALASQQEEMS